MQKFFTAFWIIKTIFYNNLSEIPKMKQKIRDFTVCEVAQSYPTLCDPMDCRLLHLWDFPGKNTGVGCHFLLQRILPTQGLNPGLPHCKQMLLPSESHKPGKSMLDGFEMHIYVQTTTSTTAAIDFFFFPLI